MNAKINLKYLSYNNYTNKIQCRNCGNSGHIANRCTQPIISVGILAFRIENLNKELEHKLITDFSAPVSGEISEGDDKCKQKFKLKIHTKYISCNNPDDKFYTNFFYFRDKIKFYLVSRKHSIGLMELMRGKYEIMDVNTLISIFKQMTTRELDMLHKHGLQKIIQDFINEMNNNTPIVNHDYSISRYDQAIKKFNQLRTLSAPNKFNFDFYYKHITPEYDYPEWGFPKGRRNPSEKNIECARREFSEETGFKNNDYILLDYFKPVNEIFFGTNDVKYKHIYYIGLINDEKKEAVHFSPEIGEKGWFTYMEAINMIRPYHTEKKNILTCYYVHILDYLIKNI